MKKDSFEEPLQQDEDDTMAPEYKQHTTLEDIKKAWAMDPRNPRNNKWWRSRRECKCSCHDYPPGFITHVVDCCSTNLHRGKEYYE